MFSILRSTPNVLWNQNCPVSLWFVADNKSPISYIVCGAFFFVLKETLKNNFLIISTKVLFVESIYQTKWYITNGNFRATIPR